MNVLLIQIDGKLPNLALMRIAAHHRERGDRVELRQGADFGGLFDEHFDRVYASTITAEASDRSRFAAEIAARYGPQALLDPPQIVVGTIHSVKGGQADVVYLFPDLSRAGDEQYQKMGAPRDSVVRLFYVGITRARDTLYICQPESHRAVSI